MEVFVNGEKRNYQLEVVRRGKYNVVGDMTPEDRERAYSLACMGLAGEVGEYVDLVKKEVHHGVAAPREKKLKELGDALWYITYAISIEESTLEEVAAMNAEKLAARYPGGFVLGGGIREGAGAA